MTDSALSFSSNTPMADPSTVRVAFIGGGNMAQALGKGMLGQQCSAQQMLVIDPSESAQAAWQSFGVSTQAQPDGALSACNIWFLAVKPQLLADVVAQCRPYLQANTLVISVAAGIRALDLSHWLGSAQQPFTRLIRCMPNTPAFVRQGVTGMLALSGVQAEERARAQQLLESVGAVVWVDHEQALDAVTALSGSGPAYVFLFLESLIAGGVALGLTEAQAQQLALQTVSGAAALAQQATEPIAQLRKNVTSEGGTTAAALAVFEQHDFRHLVAQALAAAAQRADELATEFAQPAPPSAAD